MGVSGHLKSWGQRIGVLRGPRTCLEQKQMSKVNSLVAAKLGGLVGASSVGFGPIVLKFGGNAGNDVPYKGNSECNRYSMFRAKSVDLVGNSSVGFGPVELKFGGNAENEVLHKGNSKCNCYTMLRAKLVNIVGASSMGFGTIELKYGENAGNKIPPKKNSKVLCCCRQKLSPNFLLGH